MDTTRAVKRLTEWDPCSPRPVGRPRSRWLDQVEEDLQKMKVRSWREKSKDRSLWSTIVKQAKTHRVVAPCEEEEEEGILQSTRAFNSSAKSLKI